MNSISLVDVMAKNLQFPVAAATHVVISWGASFVCDAGVILQSTLEPVLHLFRGPMHHPVSCKYPARTRCPGAPSLAAHRDTGLRSLAANHPCRACCVSISTVVFLQNSKRELPKSSFEHLQRFQFEIICVE